MFLKPTVCLLINPWETPEGSSIWKTEAMYWTWLRGSLRRLWADYPLRKEWKKRQLRPVTEDERLKKVFHTSTKNVGQCVYCGEWFPGSRLECDHKEASLGCTSKETAESFLWHCGGGIGDAWVLSCKPCHKIKSHAEARGFTMKQAAADKEAILLQKQKKDKEWLSARGYIPASNQEKRREQIFNILSEEI